MESPVAWDRFMDDDLCESLLTIPIYQAIMDRHLERLADILQTEYRCDYCAYSPLHLSTSLKWYDGIKIILKYEVMHKKFTNQVGLSPFHIAVQNNDIIAMRLFITNIIMLDKQAPNMYSSDSSNTMNLYITSTDGRLTLQSMVNHSDPETQHTALHMAVLVKALDAFELLLEFGADINARNAKSQTPLILACRQNDVHISKLLLDAGANPNLAGYFGKLKFTPLGVTARYNHVSIARLLLAHGANINAPDFGGPCPLFTAISNGASDVVWLLLREGPAYQLNPRIVCGNGDSLLHAVINYRDDDRLDVIMHLVRSGCSVNKPNKIGDYPLMDSIHLTDLPMIRTLIDLGADLCTFNKWGENALHMATSLGFLDGVHILLQSGADINAKTTAGITPLYLAMQYNREALVTFLIDFGCRIQLQPNMFHAIVDEESLSRSTTALWLQSASQLPDKLCTLCLYAIRIYFAHTKNGMYLMSMLPLPKLILNTLCYIPSEHVKL